MNATSANPSARLIPTGVRYMLASAFFFSLMSLLVKLAGRAVPSQEIVLARGIVTLLLSYWLVRRALIWPWGQRRWILILRGLVGFAAMSCFYFALTRLPLAEATVLHYTNPIWTGLLAALLLRERLSAWVAGPIAMSFVGVVLITRPAFLFGSGAAEIDLVGVGVALLGAMLSAGAYVAVREASKTEHALVIVFYFPLITVPASLPFASGFVWPPAWVWLVLLGVGVATQIAQIFLTRGLSLEPAARAMAVGYAQILFVVIWGILFFEEYLDVWSATGSLLVIAGTLAVALKGKGPVPGAAHTERASRELAGAGRP
ncbi:MAG: DMT family transporter [Gemmatimonadota bacterium]|nr:MAG: DMT family transporter [Gemmatimonadota bacterium]